MAFPALVQAPGPLKAGEHTERFPRSNSRGWARKATLRCEMADRKPQKKVRKDEIANLLDLANDIPEKWKRNFRKNRKKTVISILSL